MELSCLKFKKLQNIFANNEVLKILLMKRKLIRYYCFINIYIVYRNSFHINEIFFLQVQRHLTFSIVFPKTALFINLKKIFIKIIFCS